jgi:hypothetical protein
MNCMRSGSTPNEPRYTEFVQKNSDTIYFNGALDVLYNGHPFPIKISDGIFFLL